MQGSLRARVRSSFACNFSISTFRCGNLRQNCWFSPAATSLEGVVFSADERGSTGRANLERGADERQIPNHDVTVNNHLTRLCNGAGNLHARTRASRRVSSSSTMFLPVWPSIRFASVCAAHLLCLADVMPDAQTLLFLQLGSVVGVSLLAGTAVLARGRQDDLRSGTFLPSRSVQCQGTDDARYGRGGWFAGFVFLFFSGWRPRNAYTVMC